MNLSDNKKLKDNATNGFIEALKTLFGLAVSEENVKATPLPGNFYKLLFDERDVRYIGYFLALGVSSGAGTYDIEARRLETSEPATYKRYRYLGKTS